MFYRTRSASTAKQTQKTEQGRAAACNDGQSPAHTDQPDWLGWDGWVNPEPARIATGARDGRLA